LGDGDAPFDVVEARQAGMARSHARQIGKINSPGDYVEIDIPDYDLEKYEKYLATLDEPYGIVQQDGSTFIYQLNPDGSEPADLDKVD
jgi:hypothetical protein